MVFFPSALGADAAKHYYKLFSRLLQGSSRVLQSLYEAHLDTPLLLIAVFEADPVLVSRLLAAASALKEYSSVIEGSAR